MNEDEVNPWFWRLVVSKGKNGFIVESSDSVTVFEEPDGFDETNRDHVIDLLYFIADYFDELGGKYDKQRITIGYERGSRYVGEDDECD